MNYSSGWVRVGVLWGIWAITGAATTFAYFLDHKNSRRRLLEEEEELESAAEETIMNDDDEQDKGGSNDEHQHDGPGYTLSQGRERPIG